MNALLEMPEVRRQVSPVSVAEYHTMGELNENGRRTELIRGIIIEKMSKSPLHYVTLQKLRRILDRQIQPGWDLRIEGPLTFVDSEPEPDLAVVRGSLESFGKSHPGTAELAIEIAVSSLEIDRVKALIYAGAGVKECWIVCPEEKRVEVFRQPSASGYGETLVVSAPTILGSTALPGVQVDLGALFS